MFCSDLPWSDKSVCSASDPSIPSTVMPTGKNGPSKHSDEKFNAARFCLGHAICGKKIADGAKKHQMD